MSSNSFPFHVPLVIKDGSLLFLLQNDWLLTRATKWRTQSHLRLHNNSQAIGPLSSCLTYLPSKSTAWTGRLKGSPASSPFYCSPSVISYVREKRKMNSLVSFQESKTEILHSVKDAVDVKSIV